MGSLLMILKLFIILSFRRMMMLFIAFIQPFFLVTIYAATAHFDSNLQNFWFTAINSSLVVCWGVFVFSTLSDIYRDQFTGVFRYNAITPTPLGTIFTFRILSNLIFAFIAVAQISILSFAIFRPTLSEILEPVWFLVVLDILLLALFSIVISGLVAMTLHARTLMNFVEYPVVVLSGLGFSLGILPNVLQFAALFLPFGFVSELIRVETGISSVSFDPLDFWLIPITGTGLLILAGWAVLSIMKTRLSRVGSLL